MPGLVVEFADFPVYPPRSISTTTEVSRSFIRQALQVPFAQLTNLLRDLVVCLRAENLLTGHVSKPASLIQVVLNDFANQRGQGTRYRERPMSGKQKKCVNVSPDPKLYRRAKTLNLNVSGVSERALRVYLDRLESGGEQSGTILASNSDAESTGGDEPAATAGPRRAEDDCLDR